MEIVIGLLGAVLGVGLFIAGFFTCKSVYAPKKVTVSDKEIAEAELEREKLIQDQAAFKDLLGYNTDIAYQMGGKVKK